MNHTERQYMERLKQRIPGFEDKPDKQLEKILNNNANRTKHQQYTQEVLNALEERETCDCLSVTNALQNKLLGNTKAPTIDCYATVIKEDFLKM